MECTGVRVSLTIFFEGENLTDERIKREMRHIWDLKNNVEIYRSENKAVVICGLFNGQKRDINWTVTTTPLAIVVKHAKEDIKYIFPFGSIGWIDIESKDYKATFYTVGTVSKLEKW